jgi:MOSC domain-containing protein YiiM
MDDDSFPGAFAMARRPGVYLRIVRAGAVAAGDAIEVAPANQPAIQIRSLVEDEVDGEVLRHAIDDSRVPDSWRRAAARALRTR